MRAWRQLQRVVLVGLTYLMTWGAVGAQGTADYGPRLVHTPAFEQLAWVGLDALYSMQWARADSAFAVLDRRHPDHPAPPFVKAAALWWQVSLDLTDTRHDAELNRLLDLCIARCERTLSARGADFEADFLLFGALGYKARFQAARGNYWRAGNIALKTLGPLKRGMKNKAQLIEFLFGSGLYNYFVVWYGEYRPIVRPLLGLFPSGDKALGLRELEASAAQRNYTQIESSLFLTEIYLFSERDYVRAERHARALHTRYPQHTLFAYYLARSLYHQGRHAEARAVVQPLVDGYPVHEPAAPVRLSGTRVTTQQFAQAGLLMGELALAEGKNAEALAYLDRAYRATLLLGWEDNEWTAKILFERGRAQDRLGRRADALWSYRTCLGVDDVPRDVRRRAEGCLERPCQ